VRTAIALLLVVASNLARAADYPGPAMDPAHVLYLAQIASQLSGYSMPDGPPPTVVEFTSAQMHEWACDGTDPTCVDIIGYYRDGHTIWIDAQQRDLSEDSVAIHELTHWLQNEHAWGGNSPCDHVQARENEAYRVQMTYIKQYEHRRVVLGAPVICYRPHEEN
jgi:hypothetical protein